MSLLQYELKFHEKGVGFFPTKLGRFSLVMHNPLLYQQNYYTECI